jgi:hypothetical protein
VDDAEGFALAHATVGVVERAAHLGRDVQGELGGKRRARLPDPGDDVVQVPAIAQLQHQEVATLGLPEVQHLDDVAVVEAHRHVSLVDHHVAELRVRQQRGEDPLEHHAALEALGAVLGGEENLRHAAVGDLPHDSVAGWHQPRS